MRSHVGSKQDFSNWLTTMFAFYVVNRLVPFEEGLELLALAQATETEPRPAAQQTAFAHTNIM
jgi:hypothetical protein